MKYNCKTFLLLFLLVKAVVISISASADTGCGISSFTPATNKFCSIETIKNLRAQIKKAKKPVKRRRGLVRLRQITAVCNTLPS